MKRAFTLVELMVSLAVLSVALSVVGVVFAITTQTVTEAAAISETSAMVRQFMLQLEEDLRHIDTTKSVLVLAGRTQAAPLNADDQGAGLHHRVLVGSHDPNDPNLTPPSYDPRRDPGLDTSGFYSNPRADVIGFITSRPTVSQAPPRSPGGNALLQSYARGTKFSPIFVAYGHAGIGEAQLTGNTWSFTGNVTHIQRPDDDPTQLSPLPLTRWHLARRATIINNASVPSLTIASGVPNAEDLRRGYTANNGQAADAVTMNLDAYLAAATPFARESPYGLPGGSVSFLGHEMLYAVNSGTPIAKRHLATVLPEPPAELRDNLGVHMLPACAWFEVEFLMPEDVRNSLDYVDQRPGLPGGENRRDDMPLWTSIPHNATYVFVPDSIASRKEIVQPSAPSMNPRYPLFSSMDGSASLDQKRIRTWPYAVRVTVRVYDERNRLSSPIVRSLVHRFD